MNNAKSPTEMEEAPKTTRIKDRWEAQSMAAAGSFNSLLYISLGFTPLQRHFCIL